MALNDVADASRDRSLHPERMIPSGAISLPAAAAAGALLLGAGVAFAIAASFPSGTLALGASILILLYNFAAKRWAVPGSIAMGAVRAANMSMGLAAGHAAPEAGWTAIPGPGDVPYAAPMILFLYILLLTALSTLEEESGKIGLMRLLHAAQVAVPWLALGLRFPPSAYGIAGSMLLSGALFLSGWKAGTRGSLIAHIRRSVLAVIALDAAILLCHGLLPSGLAVASLMIPSLGMIQAYRHV